MPPAAAFSMNLRSDDAILASDFASDFASDLVSVAVALDDFGVAPAPDVVVLLLVCAVTAKLAAMARTAIASGFFCKIERNMENLLHGCGSASPRGQMPCSAAP